MPECVVRVANCAAVSAPRRAQSVFTTALTKPGKYGLPDVVLAMEVAPVPVGAVAHSHGFDGVQFGQVDSARAGSAVAVRRATFEAVGKPRMRLGSKETREGGGIRDRWWVSDKVRPVRGKGNGRRGKRMWAGHAPPPRAPRARSLFVRTVPTLRGLAGADFNLHPDALRNTFTRKVRAIGVLGLVIPRGLRATPAAPCEIGSDHLAVDVLVKW